MNYYLIGMMGSGKTTVGSLVAKKLNMTFIDLDLYIEDKYQKKIKDIFIESGEETFRTYESKCLKELSNISNSIISLGGGTLTNITNMDYLNGNIIYLDTKIETILSRITKDDRPLYKDEEQFRILYNQRSPLYKVQADYIIKNKNLDKTINKIIKMIKKENKDKKILVINGPNLNMLGLRDKKHYGNITLKEINKNLKKQARCKIKFYQSNYEGKIITFIQKHRDYDAYILNLGAYTHTSIAIRDALELCQGLKVEVHLSDVLNREDFRKINYIKDLCDKSFINMKDQGYYEALNYILDKINL